MTRSLHFLYHEVRPAESRYSYVTSCEDFQAHCALYSELLRAGTPHQLRPEITFDDGHSSDAKYALPLLTKAGLTARFFITAGWTGTRAGFMDWPQLRELRAAGQAIGAHGLTHKLLTACTQDELIEELRASKERLEDGLGCTIDTMSLPGGRANARVMATCSQIGFTQVFTSVPRAEFMDQRPETVGRLNLLGGTSVPWLTSMLDVRSGALSRLQRADRLKTLAKKALGDQLYAKIWALANRQESPADGSEIPTL